MNLNKAIVCGRVTKTPELKSTTSNQSVTSFTVATNRQWTDKQGEKKEESDFHNIVVFGKQAENCCKWLVKGQECLVEGRIQTRTYEKDGRKNYFTEIVAENVQFGQKPKNSDAVEEIPTVNIDEEIKAEDLPF